MPTEAERREVWVRAYLAWTPEMKHKYRDDFADSVLAEYDKRWDKAEPDKQCNGESSSTRGTDTYRYFEQCGGCPEGHSSFWKTVIESPQWAKWEKEQVNRFHKTEIPGLDRFDYDESRECGWISQKRFQEFLKFVTAQQDEFKQILKEEMRKLVPDEVTPEKEKYNYWFEGWNQCRSEILNRIEEYGV